VDELADAVAVDRLERRHPEDAEPLDKYQALVPIMLCVGTFGPPDRYLPL
jgi:hypothetical protein